MKRGWCVLLAMLFLFATGCGTPREPSPSAPSKSGRGIGEMRGVWITYYELDDLLDGKTAQTAPQVIDDMMKRCADYGLNTVFFHVRGNSDAYYASDVYPAAASVTALLKDGFDPLEQAVTAAHAHGLELHAWINPYRVGKDADRAQVKQTFTYEKVTYYAPHDETVQELILSGVREVVENYEVDGVQFDDYFYPVGGVPADKPAAFEEKAFAAYQKEVGEAAASIGDWRRMGVDALIRQVHNITQSRAGCVFGVSPAADIDRVCEDMYADIKGWMRRGDMVDYVCPQIYFGFEHETYPFHKTVAQWQGYERHNKVTLYIGLALYKTGQADTYAGAGEKEWQTHDSIMARSVNWLRTRETVDGFSFFSYRHFTPADTDLSKEAQTIAEKELKALQEIL